MAIQYPTEREELNWSIERLRQKYEELIADQVSALKDLENKGILTKEQAEKVREVLGLEK